MPAFKKLGPGDQIDNVLVLEPQWELVSGSSGWRGSPEGSASVSLFEGAARRPGGVVQEYQYEPIIPAQRTYGQLRRNSLITSSVNFVYMTNEDRTLTQRSNTRWGYEHWKTVMGLYDYYSRRDSDYTTSSYDHYVLYFQKDSRNVVALSGTISPPTGSFTIESWIKPFHTNATNDFTIQSRNNVFWFGIRGSQAVLALSSSYGLFTASAGPSAGDWSHAAVVYDSTTLTGTFYLNLTSVGSFTMSPLSASVSATLHTVGNRLDGYGGNPEGSWSTGSLSGSFHGFIGESRVWRTARTATELSASYGTRLSGDDLTSAQVTLWFNEGPLSRVYGNPMGSGVLDQSQAVNGGAFPYGTLRGFNDRSGPGWHPSDNLSFYVPKQFAPPYISGSDRGDDVSRMLVVTVPTGMYGRCIVPESLRLTCNAFSSSRFGMSRTLIDDGRGGLFISGSCSKDFALDYPATTAEAFTTFGVSVEAGYLCDETSGDLVPTFGQPTLALNGAAPQYGLTGPKGGTDKAIKFLASTSSFEDLSTSYFTVGSTSDLFVTWAARINVAPVGNYDFIQSLRSSGWGVQIGTSGMTLRMTDAPYQGIVAPTTPGHIIGEYHVGVGVFERSTGKVRIAIKGVDSGLTYISTTSTISTTASFAGSNDFRVGKAQTFGAANTDTELAAFYVSTASLAAAGIPNNMTGVLDSLIEIINSRDSLASSPSVNWNKVGNVFYDEGLVVIKDPALLDFAGDWTAESSTPSDLLQLSFRGQSRIPVKTLMCRIDRGELNRSLNSTFYQTEDDGYRSIRHPSGSVYVTTVGVYNKDHELVGVARLAEPLRVRPRDRFNIKIRMDF